MKRIFLRTAYDGTAYCGSQIQPELPTVEGTLANVLSELSDENVLLTGASRTDAGVHAYGNVYVFDTTLSIPPDRFKYAINTKLPPDIRVVESMEVPADFHPRHSVINKTYEYHIDDGFIELPFKERYSAHVRQKLDIEAMNEAAVLFIGEHDFTSFCSAKTEKEDHVRIIYNLNVTASSPSVYDNRDIVISITGNGFLYNMVRIIAGTLAEVGKGKIKPAEISEILSARDRTKAGPTLPPNGLFLLKIRYEDFEK